MKKDEIIILTRGCYSDYGIEAVFTNEKSFKQFMKDSGLKLDIDGGDCYKEIHKVNPACPKIPKGHSLFYVVMKEDGSSTVEDEGKSRWRCFEHMLGTINFNMHLKLCTYVVAKDEQHAIKIVNEKRAQIIALTGWPSCNEDRSRVCNFFNKDLTNDQ